MNDSLLKATGLWQRTSGSGRRYLVGRLGSAKVLILPNDRRQGDDEPSHHLLVAPAPERPATGILPHAAE